MKKVKLAVTPTLLLVLLITLFTSVLFFSSITFAFEVISTGSHRFPGLASNGSGAFVQKSYKVICDDGHEISCLVHIPSEFSGILVGCAANNTETHNLYFTDKSLLTFDPSLNSRRYLPSATLESIARARCINAEPQGRP